MDLREAVGARRHPWEVARSRFFRRVVRRWSPRATTVIDVGAGDGWFASQLLVDLPLGTEVVCWDAGYTADELGAPLPGAVRRTDRPPSHPASLVLALDVLEHIEHDHDFVREQLVPLVAPGGTLVVSVPAHQSLFTSHDRALGHHRRHSARSLHALISPHFHVVASGSLFMSLLPPRAAAAAIERLRRRSDEPRLASSWSHGRLLTAVVTAVLDLDAVLCLALARLRIRLPGLSVWTVATTRTDPGASG